MSRPTSASPDPPADPTGGPAGAGPDRRIVHLVTDADGTDRVLATEDLARTALYTTRHYAGDELVQIDHVRDGRIELVQYLDRDQPDEDLLSRHRARYGATPCEVVTESRDGTGGSVVLVYRHDAAGALAEIAEQITDARGELLAETRRLPDATLLERVSYEYDESGELVGTRVTGPDGTTYAE